MKTVTSNSTIPSVLLATPASPSLALHPVAFFPLPAADAPARNDRTDPDRSPMLSLCTDGRE